MIVQNGTKSIYLVAELGPNISYCLVRNGRISNKEKLMTKREFEKFLSSPRGMKMRYEYSIKGHTVIRWKKGE